MTAFHPSRSRRTLLRTALVAGALTAVGQLGAAQSSTRHGLSKPEAAPPAPFPAEGSVLVLLGTKGGPTPSPLRAAAANALVIDGQPYLIDCGNGVAQQLAKAGIRLPMLRDIFLTHLHSDHSADLLNVVWLAWASGLQTAVHLYGPPGIAKMVNAFVEMNAIDIKARIREEGRPPFKQLIHLHEFDQPGTVLKNDQVTVTATLVDHYTLKPAFAYRFEARDRSVVFSGDTRYLPALAEFAKNTDILVHEVMYLPALQKMLQNNDNAPTLLDHLLKSHSTSEEVGKIAAAAKAKMLVLNHFVPGGDASITDAMWSEGARRHYAGPIVVGKDLMRL
ncbi:MBL fold metallo-hydrolase [Xanthomonas vasicola]|uniref:MBL fold metallo-hydrolase n=1 Tax=Xanthomonas vasicola TaxID=56459 RepID=A0ABD7SER0_XANVA|nr:MBL fold metallo-hydrolase [Xanthomonas vasicola]AZR22270.1 MBL fold metallo-hydrolase [Xanthomonas vasicola]KGR42234.1 beta-lactamase [Xanthomonas vasicola]KGR44935.1 beta-lactamase [Xanthomonas vasicola]KGR61370.1 beta-lactamase [Xanthomonas vasicola]MDO6983647.1 MBL fold metallo-hydrolase [Xanthomonas vasicola]